MTLEECLKGAYRQNVPEGTIGTETDWLPFCELDLHSGRLWVGDPSHPYESEGVVMDGPPGTYLLHAKVMDYGMEKRTSRLRVLLRGTSAVLGGEIGEAGTDSAQIGVCDMGIWTVAWPDNADDETVEALWKRLEPMLNGLCGIARFDPAIGAVMPFIVSGYGDGCGPVYELLSGPQRVGVELQFIASGEPYP